MKIFMNRRELPEHEQDEAQDIANTYVALLPELTLHSISAAELAARYPARAELILRADLRVEITPADMENARHNAANFARAANNTEDDGPADEMGNAL